MRKTVIRLAALLTLTLGTALPAARSGPGGLPRAFFSATTPGSFARYERTTTDARGRVSVTIATISRLANEGGEVWLEVRREPGSGGEGKTSTVKYLLNEGFEVEKNVLDYRRYIDRVIAQDEGNPAVELPMYAFRTQYASFLSNVDYSAGVTPRGTETVDGRACERYGLSGTFRVPVALWSVARTYEGDLWLNDSVPFGRVKESIVVKDRKGNLVSTSETRLLETGNGARSRIKGDVFEPDPFGGVPP